MANPTTYASAKQFIGIAKEVDQGTAVAPVITVPVDKFDPEDVPVWVNDGMLRGSMVESYGKIQGPKIANFSVSGLATFDALGYFLANILGGTVYSGTATGSGATTLAAPYTSGTLISTTATVTGATLIQVGSGTGAEVRTTVPPPSGGGPYTVALDTALSHGHLSGVAVTPITTPYLSTFSVLNSGSAQPGSLTITDLQGTTATVGARAYPGACLSELTIKGNAESEAITWDAKGQAWPSAPAVSTPTSAPSTVPPLAAWRYQLGLAGPASSGTLVKTSDSFEISIKRELEPKFTGQNSQNPYWIQRGKVTVTGKLHFSVAADETVLTYMLNNTQPQVQILISNGGTGATALALQFDMKNAAFTKATIDRGKTAVAYDSEFEAVANTTNAGYSGGYSPISVVLTNAVTAGSY